MPALLLQPHGHTGDIIEVARVELVRVNHIEIAARARMQGLAQARIIQTSSPPTAQPEQLPIMGQRQAVAQHVLIVALLIGTAALYLTVVRGIAVALQIAVIALTVVVIQCVLQAGRVTQLIIEDRTQPAHPLLVTPIGNVVVLEAAALVDLHGAAIAVENRRSPVGTVFLVLQILHRQGMAQIGRQVAE